MKAFDVEDALDIGTVSNVGWNDDGSRVGYHLFGDGETRFAHVSRPDTGETVLDRPDEGGTAVDLPGDVSDFAWRPDHPDTAAVVADGDVHLVDAAVEESRTLSAADTDHASLTWVDANRLAYLRDGAPWLHDLQEGSVRRLDLGEAETSPFGAAELALSPAGDRLLTHRAGEDGPGGLVVYDLGADAVTWEWAPDAADEETVAGYGWVDEDQLVYVADATDAGRRAYRSVRPAEDDDGGVTLCTETADVVTTQAVVESDENGRFACLSARTGFAHVYVVDAAARRDAISAGDVDTVAPGFEGAGVVQVTAGDFEARGDATDSPSWSPDGDRLAYVTNEADPGERRLHVASVDSDFGVDVEQVFDHPGNVVHPSWGEGGEDEDDAGGIACIRAGRKTAADVHVADPGAGALVRATDVGHVGTESFPDPEPVSFEGANGLTVHGYCYAPEEAEASDDRPAVVWCHGGPIRQMRRGFHHMRSYASFHAFNHVLVSRGYVVLELNYRGGVGYGQAFETGIRHAIGVDDVDDCVRAADWLREHPAVGDRVGLWGLSYGGFLANAVATKTDAFDCAVNFAGIWDWRDWVDYASGLGWGAGRRFAAMFGGYPGAGGPFDADAETVAARYEAGSPREFREGLDTPLYALHGTDDPNVPFDQLDGLISDLVADGTDFEESYYPEEDHMFQEPATWRDALGRVLPFLDEHLRE